MAKWQKLASVSEFADNDRKFCDVDDDIQLGLFKVDEAYYAVDIWCSHQRVSMITGYVDGCELTCPLHGASFDLKSGDALTLPAVQGIKTYKVKIEGEDILVKV